MGRRTLRRSRNGPNRPSAEVDEILEVADTGNDTEKAEILGSAHVEDVEVTENEKVMDMEKNMDREVAETSVTNKEYVSKKEVALQEIVVEQKEVTLKEEMTKKEEVSGKEDLRLCKHPLENTWSFWLQANNNKKEWKDNLVELTSFETVEDFWCLYHHTKLPSELQSGQDYAIFKKGIEPMWEDKQNRRGGRWLIMVERGNDAKLNSIWLDTVLLVIGENFIDNNAITGVVVNIRNYSKIGIWTKDHKDTKVNMRIGYTLKSVLGIRKIEYSPHNTSRVMHTL